MSETNAKRTPIPKRLRKEVWEHRFGKKYIGKCSVVWCNSELESLGSWHVGHNKPVANGGGSELENLFPLCEQCNLSMSTKSIDEFNSLVRVKIKRWNCCFV